MVLNVYFTIDDGNPFNDPEIYRRLVAKLNYLTISHLDIAFAMSVVNQFMTTLTI